MQDLLKRFYQGETRALAKVISIVENESSEKEEVLQQLYSLTGRSYIVGVTGAPGAGKSSVVDDLIAEIRKNEQTVGIIAVDPTSPFSGGALLGDRIRMQEHTLDKGVFIRSMGTRGSLGGLARTTKEVVKVIDAFGMDYVLIETVGVGQAELDIMHVADTTVVMLTPGAGDSIQTIKAGIMEIADIFAVNKCDLPGADKVALEVEMMLDVQGSNLLWRPPVVLTSTVTKQGIAELLKSIEKHRDFLKENGLFEERRRKRTHDETLEIVSYRWEQIVRREMTFPGKVSELLAKVMEREIDPYSAATSILKLVATSKAESKS